MKLCCSRQPFFSFSSRQRPHLARARFPNLDRYTYIHRPSRPTPQGDCMAPVAGSRVAGVYLLRVRRISISAASRLPQLLSGRSGQYYQHHPKNRGPNPKPRNRQTKVCTLKQKNRFVLAGGDAQTVDGNETADRAVLKASCCGIITEDS